MSMPSSEKDAMNASIQAHYAQPDLGSRILSALEKAGKLKRKTAPGLPPGVIEDRAGGEAQAIKAAAKLRLPVYYPAVRLAAGGVFDDVRII